MWKFARRFSRQPSPSHRIAIPSPEDYRNCRQGEEWSRCPRWLRGMDMGRNESNLSITLRWAISVAYHPSWLPSHTHAVCAARNINSHSRHPVRINAEISRHNLYANKCHLFRINIFTRIMFISDRIKLNKRLTFLLDKWHFSIYVTDMFKSLSHSLYLYFISKKSANVKIMWK